MFGYESPLTTLGNQFLPDWIYFDKVGLIDRVCVRQNEMQQQYRRFQYINIFKMSISIVFPIQMYDFTGDYETFYTGETNVNMSGLYDTFLGSKNLKQWEGDHCSNINGASDGTKFKSYIEAEDELLFFRKSMCRPQRVVSIKQSISSIIDTYFH